MDVMAEDLASHENKECGGRGACLVKRKMNESKVRRAMQKECAGRSYLLYRPALVRRFHLLPLRDVPDCARSAPY